MRYQLYSPSALLRPYIRSFAVSESSGQGRYTVLPDTGLVIGLQYEGRIALEAADGAGLPNDSTKAAAAVATGLLSTAGITGLHDGHRIFRNEGRTGSLLIYFRTMGAAAFMALPVHELFRQSISLDHLFPRQELRDLEDQLAAAVADEHRIALTEAFLLRRLRPQEPDGLVVQAVERIVKSGGKLPIAELASELHISQSPLEKRFRRLVGASPKKFASIVQLQQVIGHYEGGESLTALSYQAGFYDQAHFIKAFRHFTGRTPADFFGKKAK